MALALLVMARLRTGFRPWARPTRGKGEVKTP